MRERILVCTPYNSGSFAVDDLFAVDEVAKEAGSAVFVAGPARLLDPEQERFLVAIDEDAFEG